MSSKLLYVINHMDWFWSHRLPLAVGAKKAGWDVTITANGAEQDQNLKAYGFSAANLPSNPLSVMAGIHCAVKKTQPDLVHVITIKYAFLAVLAAILNPQIKFVYTIAGLGYLFSGDGIKPAVLRAIAGPFLKLGLKRANTQVIFQNSDDMRIMIARGFVRPDQCHLILGSGVDTHKFAARPEPQNSAPVIVMPTRLVHDKGVAVFAEAAHILRERGVNGSFHIAGGLDANNPRAFSLREIEALTANGAARWLGKVEDMPALLSDANLIVYPSYYREGVPKVLLEAASAGRAIVTTDHPGCREAVAQNDNGLLVPVKDSKATADAIEILLKDSDLRARMGEQGRRRAEKEFDVRIIVEKTLAVYSA